MYGNAINQKIYKSKKFLKDKISKATIDIPFIMNCYWDNPILPFMNYLSIKSFTYYNPHWNINVYIPFEMLQNLNTIANNFYWQELYNMDNVKIIPIILPTNSISFMDANIKKDYVKWHILYVIGGIWSDLDILYINSVENTIFSKNFTKKLVILKNNDIYLTKFILASKNNNIINSIKNFYLQNKENITNNDILKNISNILDSYAPQILAINKQFYIPFDKDILMAPNTKLSINENSIGIYWYDIIKISNDANILSKIVIKLMEILKNDDYNKNILPLCNILK
jgi:hypothetical protein